jgi:hypothetical protein
MACTISSLFLFATPGIVAIGLASRPNKKATPPVQRDQATAPTSGHCQGPQGPGLNFLARAATALLRQEVYGAGR